jgi:hypothetical protein
MDELRPGADVIDMAHVILRHQRDRLAVRLAHPHELVLVGGSSLPLTLTKGDVDLHLRVPVSAFAPVVTALSEIYEVVHRQIWQPTLATFLVEAVLPAGMAVTPAGSEHDLRFTRSWQRLAADPALVLAYNDLKVRYRDDPGEYERQKSAFFDSLVSSS